VPCLRCHAVTCVCVLFAMLRAGQLAWQAANHLEESIAMKPGFRQASKHFSVAWALPLFTTFTLIERMSVGNRGSDWMRLVRPDFHSEPPCDGYSVTNFPCSRSQLKPSEQRSKMPWTSLSGSYSSLWCLGEGKIAGHENPRTSMRRESATNYTPPHNCSPRKRCESK